MVAATALALGLAGYAGWALHRARTIEGERIRNGLLNEERARIDSMLTMAAESARVQKTADSVQIAALVSKDRQNVSTSASLRSTVAHLTDQARTVTDSLRLIPVMESAIAQDAVTIDGLTASRDTALAQRDRAYAANARLLVVTDSVITRLVTIARTRPSVPVVKDRKLLGLFHVTPCLFTGVSTTLRPTAGAGICVTG